MTVIFGKKGRGHVIARRRGYAAVIAMIFLVIGTSLVAGLYAMVTTATAITANEQNAAQALGAAETGMNFMRHQLCTAAAATTFHGTDSSQWIQPLYDALTPAMNGTATLGGKSLTAPAGFTISIPTISLGDGTSFTALVEPTANNQQICLIVTGKSAGGLTRMLEVNFSGPSAAGPVQFPMQARGGIASAINVNATGSKGETYPTATVPLVGGGTADVLLYPGMAAPSTMAFPDNTSLIQMVSELGLKSIADSSTRTTQTTTIPAVYDKKGKLVAAEKTVTTVISQNSCTIPPNTNPTLSGTINGIVYVQWPNNVTIGSSLTLNGTLVFERQNGNSGTVGLNAPRGAIIDRSMNAAAMEMAQFPSAIADQLKWWSIIAPDVDLVMSNGTTWDTDKGFEGSVNIKSFTRQGGGDQVAFDITMGGLVAEGTINVASNGARILINTDSSGGGGTSNGNLSLVATSYQELVR